MVMELNKEYIENCIRIYHIRLLNTFSNNLGKLYFNAVHNSQLGSFFLGKADPTDGIKYNLKTRSEVFSLIYNYDNNSNISYQDILSNIQKIEDIDKLFYFSLDWCVENFLNLSYETQSKLQNILEFTQVLDSEYM